MSYDTRVQGELELTPPVPYAAFRESPFWPRNKRAYDAKDPAVKLRVEEHDEDTPDGTLTRREATAIVPAWEEEMRAYHIEKELAQLVGDLPAGTQVSGYLEGFGADDLDFWRLYVRPDGTVVKVHAKITWELEAVGLGSDETLSSAR